jgi:hypothetical protein
MLNQNIGGSQKSGTGRQARNLAGDLPSIRRGVRSHLGSLGRLESGELEIAALYCCSPSFGGGSVYVKDCRARERFRIRVNHQIWPLDSLAAGRERLLLINLQKGGHIHSKSSCGRPSPFDVGGVCLVSAAPFDSAPTLASGDRNASAS